jgi:hypothetical protein
MRESPNIDHANENERFVLLYKGNNIHLRRHVFALVPIVADVEDMLPDIDRD